MDCFPDICLNCDRESPEGIYCSPACELADAERASVPSSPTSLSHGMPFALPHWTPSQLGSGTLPQAYPFPHSRNAASSKPDSHHQNRPSSSYLKRSPSQKSSTEQNNRSLTPSSSRSSLSSTSGSQGYTISEQAKQELQGYFNALDQTKASKRRQSTW